MGDIDEAVEKRKWLRLSRLLRALLEKLFSKKIIGQFTERLGEKQFRRLLVRISARAIPFIGWAIMVGSIVVSTINNYPRIEKALKQ